MSRDHDVIIVGARVAGASTAMLHVLVSLAFLRTDITDLRAQLAKFSGAFATTGHKDGCRAAEFCTLEVELDAAREHLYVLFVETGGRAVLAFDRAFVGGVDATAHGFVGHFGSLLEG